MLLLFALDARLGQWLEPRPALRLQPSAALGVVVTEEAQRQSQDQQNRKQHDHQPRPPALRPAADLAVRGKALCGGENKERWKVQNGERDPFKNEEQRSTKKVKKKERLGRWHLSAHLGGTGRVAHEVGLVLVRALREEVFDDGLVAVLGGGVQRGSAHGVRLVLV